MRRPNLQIVLGTVVLVGTLVAVYFLLQLAALLLTSLGQANPTVASAVIAALAAAMLAMITVWNERRKSIREAHRQQKIEVYSIWVDMVFGIIQAQVATKKPVDDAYFARPDFQSEMIKFKRNLVFYGSPRVIKAFNAFMKVPNDSTHTTMMLRMGTVGEMFLAMRADLGLSNFALSSDELHRLYVTDYDAAVAQGAAK